MRPTLGVSRDPAWDALAIVQASVPTYNLHTCKARIVRFATDGAFDICYNNDDRLLSIGNISYRIKHEKASLTDIVTACYISCFRRRNRVTGGHKVQFVQELTVELDTRTASRRRGWPINLYLHLSH